MDRYQNRVAAGQRLAKDLATSRHHQSIVFALACGGVQVACEIARELAAPLEVFMVKKLMVPGQSELVMGAVALDGTLVLNERVIREFKISPTAIKRVSENAHKELITQASLYSLKRAALPLPPQTTAILVDEGIATGATMRAAILSLRKLQPQRIILAVPVAEKSMCEKMAEFADEIICPLQPPYLTSLCAHYQEFDPLKDEELIHLIKQAQTFSMAKNTEQG